METTAPWRRLRRPIAVFAHRKAARAPNGPLPGALTERDRERRAGTARRYNPRMADVISLNKRRRRNRREAASGRTLCRIGRHKWETDHSTPFAVREGRLVTVRRCLRCGAKKTELS